MSLSQVEKEIEKLQKNFLIAIKKEKEVESQIKNKKNIINIFHLMIMFILLEKVHDQILKIISIISLMILLNYMEIV